jgi:hypothetical protein
VIPIRVTTTFPELVAWLGQLATKQVPFATAKALTRVAQDAQAEVRKELPHRFTLRSSWLVQGIRIVPAEKRDWPKARAIVGTRDQFLEIQETGGTKRPAKGAKNLAIPTAATTSRRTGTGRIPIARKPRALLDRPDVFVKDHGIRQRRRRKTSGTPVLTLFLLRPAAKIKPRLGLRETVQKVVEDRYALRFREAFDQAIQTPRRAGRPR